MEKIKNFTEGPIFKPLIMFTLPVVLSMLLQVMYGAVDIYVVGKFASTPDMSGVTTGSQMMMTVTNLISGLAMGLTIILGHKIGEKRSEEAGDVIGTGICLFGIAAVAVTAVILVFSRQLVTAMQAPEEAFSQTLSYVRICGGGLLFVVAYNLLGGIFRGIGDSKTPLISVAIACVFNIAGDLLLVAVFKMGAAGAAIATAGAQFLSVVISVFILSRRELPFTLTRDSLRLRKEYASKTLRMGFPVALQSVMVGLSFLVVTAIVNGMGLVASAAIGVAEKLSGFILLVPICFMQSLSAYVAQNYGANTLDRAKKAVIYGIIVSLSFGIVMGWLSFFHGDRLAMIFNKDIEVIAATAQYMKAYALDTMIVPFLFCFTGYFNGCGKTDFATVQSLIGAFLIRVPASYLFSISEGASMFRIGLATPMSSIVQVIICTIYFIFINKKISVEQNRITD